MDVDGRSGGIHNNHLMEIAERPIHEDNGEALWLSHTIEYYAATRLDNQQPHIRGGRYAQLSLH